MFDCLNISDCPSYLLYLFQSSARSIALSSTSGLHAHFYAHSTSTSPARIIPITPHTPLPSRTPFQVSTPGGGAGKRTMDMIGQRLFTGRVAVAQAALAFAMRCGLFSDRDTLATCAMCRYFADFYVLICYGMTEYCFPFLSVPFCFPIFQNHFSMIVFAMPLLPYPFTHSHSLSLTCIVTHHPPAQSVCNHQVLCLC